VALAFGRWKYGYDFVASTDDDRANFLAVARLVNRVADDGRIVPRGDVDAMVRLLIDAAKKYEEEVLPNHNMHSGNLASEKFLNQHLPAYIRRIRE
jgi:chromatin segregation and condensation protein Rec8/ScpA/Scc1 (kleisin family)